MVPVEQETLEPLRAELHDFETCLETPFVPGEMERWMDAARQAWGRLTPAFLKRFESEQPELFDQIAADDPELLERVDELRQHNGRVLAMHRDLSGLIERLSQQVPRVEPDEKRLDEQLSRFVEQGLQFVIAARKQEVALRTWMLEAYQRETGPVD